MADFVVVRVKIEGSKDHYQLLQDVVKVPNDISWQDFELLLKMSFDVEEMQAKYLDEDNDEIHINSDGELFEAFKVATKQQNELHIKITPMETPSVDVVFEDEQAVTIDVKKKKVTITNTKQQEKQNAKESETVTEPEENQCAQEVQCPLEEVVVECPLDEVVIVSESEAKEADDVEMKDSTNEKMDDSYIKPTTDECVIVEDEESATVFVEDLDELKESVASASACASASASASAPILALPLPTSTPSEPRKDCFRLRNKATKKLLDVETWDTRLGTPLVLYEGKTHGPKRRPPARRNEVFYEDKKHGTIFGLFSKMCIDATESGVVISPFSPSKNAQQWMMKEGRIQHRYNSNWVIGIDVNVEGDKLSARKRDDSDGQLWITEQVYVSAEMVSAPRLQSRPTVSSHEESMRKLWEMAVELRNNDRSAQLSNLGVIRPIERIHNWSMNQEEQQNGEGEMSPGWSALEEEEEIVCLESGETSRRPPTLPSDVPPPEWFDKFMEKFSKNMAKDISQMVSQYTVQQILSGLEGAVIASVPGTSGRGAPNQEPRTNQEHTRQDSMSSNASSGTIYCHSGVLCDYCDRTIVGIRYKCGNCEDFDLCEECEVLDGIHDPEHVFLKIRRPTLTAGRKLNGKMMPLLKRSVYVSPEDIQKKLDEKAAKKETKKQENKEIKELKKEHKEESKARKAAEKLAEKANKIAAKFQKYEEKLARKQDAMVKKQESRENKTNQKKEVKEEQVKRKEERLKRRGEVQKTQKETPTKKEKLDLPQFRLIERMDAAFVEDVTFPDGSHIQPGTKFTKRWLLRNVGTHAWTTSTKLKHLWGGMEPISTDVGVPSLELGEEGVISVQILAPQVPGVYQSHWRLSHHGLYFGHRVWCHIVVDEKEVLEHSAEAEQESVLTVQREEYEPVKGSEGEPSVAIEDVDGECEIIKVEEANSCESDKPVEEVSDERQQPSVDGWRADGITEQDIEMFEMLDIRDRNQPKVSQTATPNNTPLVTSPPKSPTLDLDIQVLSSSSSVEVVSDVSPSATTDEVTQRMTELVQERIASLGLRPDIDLESISSFTDSEGDDSDSDFYIVPLPDCFNPELPCSTSTTTSIVVKKEDAVKSVDEMFTASHEISTEPLTPTSSSSEGEPEVIDLTESEEGVVEVTEFDQEVTEVKQQETLEGAVGGEVQDENGNSSECTTPDEEKKDMVKEAKKRGREASPSAGEVASNITVAALGVLSQAAVSAFTLTKDVFHTLQAQHNFVPPKSDWKPKEQTFTPPKSNWTPPEQTLPASVVSDDFTPPEETWISEQTEAAPVPKTPSPIEQLIEMGFANRELNEKLLKENNNDLMKVVQELVNMGDQDWNENRH